MSTVKNATAAIARAARQNKFITSAGLREEAVNGQIDGWLNLAAIRAVVIADAILATDTDHARHVRRHAGGGTASRLSRRCVPCRGAESP